MDKKNEIEFDLIDLLLYMKKRLWIIILVVVVFTLAGYVGSKMLLTPEYTASARMYVAYNVVNPEDDDILGQEYTQQLMAGQLRNDCVELLSDVAVTQKVVDNLQLDTSAAGVSGSLSIKAVDNTRVLSLSVVDTNPQRAAQILNEICKVGEETIEEMLGADVLEVLHYAEVPGSPSSPSPKRNATVAAILGLVAAVSIMVVIFLMDDSIRNETDIEHYLGLSTLAEIPVSAELSQGKKGIDGAIRGLSRRKRK